MNIWITTDTHFNHERVKDFGRPDDFEQKLLRGFKVMQPGDVFLHLGDICIGGDEEAHERMFAAIPEGVKKILVRGNHDHKSNTWYLAHGWDFVCREFVDKYFGKLVLFTHVPIGVEAQGALYKNIHGHFHGLLERDERISKGKIVGGGTYDKSFHYECAPDTHNYQMVNLKKLL